MTIKEWLKDPTAPLREIGKRAGYKDGPALDNQMHEVLSRPHVKAEMRDQMHALVTKERLSVERLLRHIIRLAEVDKRDFFHSDGTLKDPKEWTKEMAALVEGFDVAEIWDNPGAQNRTQIGHLKKVKIASHMRTLDMLGKHLQAFVERIDLNAKLETKHTEVRRLEVDMKLIGTGDLHELHAIAERVEQERKRLQAEGTMEEPD
jgi:phage terminase small subunit